MGKSERNPWRRAFRLERAFPVSVRGPVERLLFSRLLTICRTVVIALTPSRSGDKGWRRYMSRAREKSMFPTPLSGFVDPPFAFTEAKSADGTEPNERRSG